MPTAPLAQRRVVDQAAPNIRLSAAPTAETLGKGIGDSIASTSVKMYDLQTRSADHADVQAAETLANNELLRIQTDVTKQRGRDAANAPDYAKKEWTAVQEEIIKGLGSNRAKAMFNTISSQKGDSLNRFAMSHFGREQEQYENDAHAALMNSSVNAARMNAMDDFMVAHEVGVVQPSEIALKAARLGYAGTEQEKNELTNVRSTTHREVIMARLDAGNDLSARAYYEKAKKFETEQSKVNERTGEVLTVSASQQFTAADRDVIEKGLQEGSTRGVSRRTVNELVERGIETADDRKARIGELNQLADAGKIDERTFDLAKQKLEHEFAQFDQFENQRADTRFTGAVAAIDEQWKTNPAMTVRDMVKTSDYAKMSVRERHTLDQYVGNLRTPRKTITDLDEWVKLNSMQDTDLANMGTRDIMQSVLKLDEGDRDKLLTRWNGARNAKAGKSDKKYEQLLTNDKIMNNAIENTGLIDISIPRSKLSDEKKRLLNRVENETAKALSSLEAGAPLEKKQQVIDAVVERMGKKFIVDPGFFRFNKEVPAGSIEEFKDARSIRVPLKDIPEDRQNALKGALRTAGMEINSQNIEALEAKSRMRKLGVQ